MWECDPKQTWRWPRHRSPGLEDITIATLTSACEKDTAAVEVHKASAVPSIRMEQRCALSEYGYENVVTKSC